jgi:aminoglycoside N3'-acetyltransferase
MKIDEGRSVYLLYNPITRLTKIGVSDNIDVRKSALENACGCPLGLIYKTKHLLFGEKYESDTHVALGKYRKHGE